MRLFTAINFNEETRSNLLGLRDELRDKSERGRFSLPENIHLTLVFIGECDATQATTAKTVMNSICIEPFDITIDSIGRFRRNGGDIWWAGGRGNKTLLELQRLLTDQLVAAGFSLEKRKYSPHITLGREIVSDVSPRQIEPFGETVSQIDLMKSERINGKLTYTSICRSGERISRSHE
jgi:2'-5' RNA ligase